MIQLIGPGGAGKTTVGAALAARLGKPFVDLDTEFTARHGSIAGYLEANGYDAYAEQNVTLYAAVFDERLDAAVVALSSGFMTYREDVHPDYAHWRQEVTSANSTLVLLPSLDFETCVAEIVRRQLRRPFARSPQREEQVIRARFPVYTSLPGRKVETMRPVDAVVSQILTALKT